MQEPLTAQIFVVGAVVGAVVAAAVPAVQFEQPLLAEVELVVAVTALSRNIAASSAAFVDAAVAADLIGYTLAINYSRWCY